MKGILLPRNYLIKALKHQKRTFSEDGPSKCHP
eukprot:UN04964